MRWVVGRALSPLLFVAGVALTVLHGIGLIMAVGFRVIARIGHLVETLSRGVARLAQRLARGSSHIGYRARSELTRFRTEAAAVTADVPLFSTEQQTSNPLDPQKQTVFLLITCGQAVRNFLLSDVFPLMRARYNVVILSPFAYSPGFRQEYGASGVHVLPWFTSFRTIGERLFQYYFMGKSRSRTHHSWLVNLEARAKADPRSRSRYKVLRLTRRSSDLIGAVIGWRGMQGVYGSYFMAYLSKSLFQFLFSTYRPALIISTTAHHPEAWPLTFFGRRNGVKTLANILSWDNTTTKPIMDLACDYYTVWSEEMKEELAYQFPHMNPEVRITGCPLFDLYYDRRGAVSREAFLGQLDLDPDKPMIFYATNTPSAMPDEGEIVAQYWEALNRSPLAGKVNLLVRLHPKDTLAKYQAVIGQPGVAVTLAAKAHWDQSDRWLPNREDMGLLLNSMLHAAVSVNVASTMSLESFALELPTINIAFRASPDIKDQGSMWSFDMYHFSEHYRAIIENGSVDLARSVDELVDFTAQALADPNRHKEAMRRTLRQKAAYSDGGASQRFVEVVSEVVASRELQRQATTISGVHRPEPIPRLAEAAE